MRFSPTAPIWTTGGCSRVGKQGAVIEDIERARARVREMLAERRLVPISGARLPTPIDSVCVHGDSPLAVEMARRLRAALEGDGCKLRAFAGA